MSKAKETHSVKVGKVVSEKPSQPHKLSLKQTISSKATYSSKKQKSPKVKWNNYYKEANPMTSPITTLTLTPIANQIQTKYNEPAQNESPSCIPTKKSLNSIDILPGYSHHTQKSSLLPSIKANDDKNKPLFQINGELNTTYTYHLINQPISDSYDRPNNNKFHTLINRNTNTKKYNNIICCNNSLKLSTNEIDESIRTASIIDWPSFKHSKTNPNSFNSSSSNSQFKTKANVLEIDKYLHKTVKGKSMTWTAGEIIAEGINSVVYKAMNEEDGSLFVVKRFNCAKDKCESFLNEIKVYDQLNHSNIIKYYSAEEIDSQLFIYLEYVPSGSLRSIIDHYGKLNETLIKHYTKQIIHGLRYLHSKGIVHRDIKCANILINSKGIVKLCDFGCSKQIAMSVSDSSSNEEFCSSLKGTIPWCAPEVICQKKYGKKADIWSLGCSLIEMGGSQPWGKVDNLYQVMTKIGRSNDLPLIPDYYSEALKGFISRCLIRDSKNRVTLKQLVKHPFVA